MKRITKFIVLCATLMTTLFIATPVLMAYSGENTGAKHAQSLEGSITQIGDWARQLSRYPLDMLGITDMECSSTFTIDDGERLWLFHVEPKIKGIDRDGPSYGILKKGDVIVAIDGMLITTRKAGLRFANLVPGESVELKVRRGRNTRTVNVVPRPVPEPNIPIDLTVQRSDRSNTLTIEPGATNPPELARSIEELGRRAAELGKRIGSKGIPATPDLGSFPRFNIDFGQMLPRGWIGFGLLFQGSIQHKDEDKPAEWHFNEPPLIKAVEPNSPAEIAGLQINDLLLEIDGLKLDSKKGGKRFSRMMPEQIIKWTVQRGDETFEVETKALERPKHVHSEYGLGSADLDILQPLRYTGTMGDTEIEVRGGKDVRVEVDEETGETVIRSGDSYVRLKPKEEH